MARFKQNNKPVRRDAFGRSVLLYSSQGQFIAAKWPEPKSAAWLRKNKIKAQGFRQVQQFFRYLPPWEHDVYVSMSEGGPFLPRDFWTMNTYQRFLAIERFDGSLLVPERSQIDVSESLDILGNPIGGILYRDAPYWKALDPGNADDVLTSNGPGAAPSWKPASGGGGGKPYNTPPKLADFSTALNNLPADLEDADNGGILVTVPDSSLWSSDLKVVLDQPRNSGNNTVEASFILAVGSSSYTNVGIWMADQSAGKGTFVALRLSGNDFKREPRLLENPDYPGFLNRTGLISDQVFSKDTLYLRAVMTSSTVTAYVALDPATWIEFASYTPTSAPCTGT